MEALPRNVCVLALLPVDAPRRAMGSTSAGFGAILPGKTATALAGRMEQAVFSYESLRTAGAAAQSATPLPFVKGALAQNSPAAKALSRQILSFFHK